MASRDAKLVSAVIVMHHGMLPRKVKTTQTYSPGTKDLAIEVEPTQSIVGSGKSVFINLIAPYEEIEVDHGRDAGHHFRRHIITNRWDIYLEIGL